MTKEEIVEMARPFLWGGNVVEGWTFSSYEQLEAFTKLVAEKEREACAKLCDDRVIAYQYATDVWAQEHIDEARHLAKAIRARGQA